MTLLETEVALMVKECLPEIAAELKKANTLKAIELKLKLEANAAGVNYMLPDSLKSAFAEIMESI